MTRLSLNYNIMQIFSLAIICVAILALGCSKSAEKYLTGRGAARADATEGYLAVARVENSQLPVCWFYYEEMLRTNYGVKSVVYSLPADPRAAEAWVRGYNEVALPEIERRFGTNVLKQAMTKARTMYDQIYPQEITNR